MERAQYKCIIIIIIIIIKSELYRMYGLCVNKKSLSLLDTKRYILADGIYEHSYGHYEIKYF